MTENDDSINREIDDALKNSNFEQMFYEVLQDKSNEAIIAACASLSIANAQAIAFGDYSAVDEQYFLLSIISFCDTIIKASPMNALVEAKQIVNSYSVISELMNGQQ